MAVAGVSLLYVALELLHTPKRWSFVVAGLALALYAIYFVRARPHSWRELGFRTDNLALGLVPVGVFTLLAAGGLVLWAAVRGNVVWGREVLLLLALYPALTFVAGVVWSVIYRRRPNLWLLAASHTGLAALAYPLVLADAPLSRL